MSLTRTIGRSINLREGRLEQLLNGKFQAGNTQSPVMALRGNTPSRVKQAFKAHQRNKDMVKLARVVTACLIIAAGGSASSVPVVQKPISRNGTCLRAPGYDRFSPEAIQARATALATTKKKPGVRPSIASIKNQSLHQRIVSKARKQAVAA